MTIQSLKDKGALWAVIGVSTFAGAVGGSTLFNAITTHAQSASPAPTIQSTPANLQDIDTETNDDKMMDPAKGGHVGKNGQKEELLSGDTAEKVKAAALGAVPGATVERVETDAEGSPYEAHIKKSDGTRATVKVDTNFKVTATEDGMR